MQKGKNKLKKKLTEAEDEEEDEEEMPKIMQKGKVQNTIQIGDLGLSSSESSLKELKKEATQIIRNKHLREYLSFCQRKNLTRTTFFD